MERDEVTTADIVCRHDFNSHAHVERDSLIYTLWNVAADFNSHAHVERDTMLPLKGNKEMNFNSHAHVERDRMERSAKQ